MKKIKQRRPKNCGQIAIAVVTGKGLRQVYRVVGHAEGMRTDEVVRALRAFGLKTDSGLLTYKKPPSLAIAKLRTTGRARWHWVVVNNGRVIDGAYQIPNDWYFTGWNNTKITSYIRIYER